MAAAATQATHRSPRRRLVAIALTLSLALNVCFVAGVVWTRLHATSEGTPPAERLRAMAAQLDLTPQQRTAFEQYFRAMRARAQSMHEEVEPLIAEAWSEMAKPQPDEAKVNQLFDEAAAKRRALQRDMASQTLAFLATLSPEQRAKFIELGREHFSSRANRIHHRGAP